MGSFAWTQVRQVTDLFLLRICNWKVSLLVQQGITHPTCPHAQMKFSGSHGIFAGTLHRISGTYGDSHVPGPPQYSCTPQSQRHTSDFASGGESRTTPIPRNKVAANEINPNLIVFINASMVLLVTCRHKNDLRLDARCNRQIQIADTWQNHFGLHR